MVEVLVALVRVTVAVAVAVGVGAVGATLVAQMLETMIGHDTKASPLTPWNWESMPKWTEPIRI